MDFITKLTRTACRLDSIWFIMDRLTKRVHFILIQESISVDKLMEVYIREVVAWHGVSVFVVSDREGERRGRLRQRASTRESPKMVPLLMGPRLIPLSPTLTRRRTSAIIATKQGIRREVARNICKSSRMERSSHLLQVYTQLNLIIHLILFLGFLIQDVVTTFVLICRD